MEKFSFLIYTTFVLRPAHFAMNFTPFRFRTVVVFDEMHATSFLHAIKEFLTTKLYVAISIISVNFALCFKHNNLLIENN